MNPDWYYTSALAMYKHPEILERLPHILVVLVRRRRSILADDEGYTFARFSRPMFGNLASANSQHHAFSFC